ncbi:MAG: hypothetical protein SNJ55_05270 [Chloroherpetonaceae bacterium]
MKRTLVVILATLFAASCGDDKTLNEPQGVAPEIVALQVSPDTIFFGQLPLDAQARARIAFGFSVTVQQVDLRAEQVRAELLNARGESIAMKEITVASSERRFVVSDTLALFLRRSEIEPFTLVVNAFDEFGRSGGNGRARVVVRPPNARPQLLSVVSPDTVRVGQFLVLKATVNDSDGLGDIASVFYFSRRPDGVLANQGNPIQMYDDGGANPFSGDDIAGDGIYSFRAQVPPTTLLGTFTYTFYARDRFDAQSDSLVRQTVILQP